MGPDPAVASDATRALLTDPAPRPPHCYDPATPPYRNEQGVHVFAHRSVRGLLRDPQRVTSDVTDLVTDAERARLHPVSSFVWATDRLTLHGCPGRHAALRAAMAPWFTPQEAAARQGRAGEVAQRLAARPTDRPFDVYADYALPLVVEYLADWLGTTTADVTYAVDDQLAAGDLFDTWPALAPPGMDDHFRALMARRDLRGVAAAARELVRAGTLTEREAWGIVYALSVSAVATATAITLAVGLGVVHDLWPGLADPSRARPAIEEAVRLGSPFPQSSRFARVPFVVGDAGSEVAVEPGEQVLLWLTAANRDLPGDHRRPLDRFDPGRDTSQHVGWGSGYHHCGGVHHARAVAPTAVTALARRCPGLGLAGPWRRFVGIDDGYRAAPVVPFAVVH